MISISDFRKFVVFIKEKIEPLAKEIEEVRSVARQVFERADEIEATSSTVNEDYSPMEDAIDGMSVEESLESDEQSSYAPAPPPPPPSPPKVKRRRTRVRHKINEKVWTLTKKCNGNSNQIRSLTTIQLQFQTIYRITLNIFT